MARVQRFEDLIAWQKSRVLCRDVRLVTRRTEFRRDFSLVDQMTRAARSTMANIAEGFERKGKGEFTHHLSIANGSNAELRSDLYCALDAGYLDEDEHTALMAQATEVGRIIGGLYNSLARAE